MPKLTDRIQHAWNAFFNKDPTQEIHKPYYSEPSTYMRPDRVVLRYGHEKSIVTAIWNRIAIDVASVKMEEVILDNNNRYTKTVKSGLTNCLTLSANIDQTGRDFIRDLVISMFDEGVVAAVPVDTSIDPEKSDGYDIDTIRVGQVIEWKPSAVKVKLYNDRTGQKEEVWFDKHTVAIVQNPLYYVMNEPNSTLQRLIRKLNLLDSIDEQSASGKIDLIIQVPYTIRNKTRKAEAEERRKDIEMQLTGSKYGIAYTDGSERITQLNRPVDNNMMSQVEYLTNMLYNQLGISQGIFDGTATEEQKLDYHNRTLEPILSAITVEFTRKFLSLNARTRGHCVTFMNDPFKLVPVSQIAEIADKFTRNEILSSNELRAIIGYKPIDDERADELRNKNLNASNEEIAAMKVDRGDGEEKSEEEETE